MFEMSPLNKIPFILVWECIYVYCCATNRIAYLSDAQAFNGSKWNLAMFIMSMFLVPLYREFHFYFAHR